MRQIRAYLSFLASFNNRFSNHFLGRAASKKGLVALRTNDSKTLIVKSSLKITSDNLFSRSENYPKEEFSFYYYLSFVSYGYEHTYLQTCSIYNDFDGD